MTITTATEHTTDCVREDGDCTFPEPGGWIETAKAWDNSDAPDWDTPPPWAVALAMQVFADAPDCVVHHAAWLVVGATVATTTSQCEPCTHCGGTTIRTDLLPGHPPACRHLCTTCHTPDQHHLR